MAKHIKSNEVVGQRFGRLEIIEKMPSKGGRSRWLCKCDCGTLKEFDYGNLRKGTTSSCGCLQKEQISARASKHRLSSTRLYKLWNRVKNRCCNPNSKDFQRYGGRGITFQWKDDPEGFIKYCYRLPDWDKEDLQIDRINSKGNYEEGNIRFADKFVQANNKSNIPLYSIFFERLSGIQAYRKYSNGTVSLGMFRIRMRKGWDIYDALYTPGINEWKRGLIKLKPKPEPKSKENITYKKYVPLRDASGKRIVNRKNAAELEAITSNNFFKILKKLSDLNERSKQLDNPNVLEDLHDLQRTLDGLPEIWRNYPCGLNTDPEDIDG